MDNSPFGEVHQHPAAADLYLRHGWKIIEIPYGQKNPERRGWNQEGNWVQSVAQLPAHTNLGLLHAFSGTCALDIDAWEAADEVLTQVGIDLNQLYNAPDAVTIESGKPGRGKLLYEMPFPSFTLPTKKIVKDGKTILELRCGTTGGTSVQDVLPPSMHPETGQAYRWGGRGKWTNLPPIPTDLLTFWQTQLQTPEKPKSTTSTPADWEEIKSALQCIPPDCNREDWRNVGMALHHEGLKSDNLEIAHEWFSTWSYGDPNNPPSNYKGQHDIDVTWRSFKPDAVNPITIGSLFDIAKNYGWKRQTPDAAKLFSSIDKPVSLLHGLKVQPPRLNLDHIPDMLATRAMEVSESVGCDPLVPLFAGIGAICAAVDGRSQLKLAHGYYVPPILWMLTIGDPSDRKSPGSRPMLSVLYDIEQEGKPDYHAKMSEYNALAKVYEGKQKAYMEWYAENDGDTLPSNTVKPDIPIPPSKPQTPLLVVQDITSQKLMHHAADQGRGLLCHLDEMNGWANKLANKHNTEDTSTWVQSYEGKNVRMDRVGSGTFEVDNFSVSIYGNIQPDVWREHLGVLARDGFVARFIPAPLRSHLSTLGEPIPDELTSKSAYESHIRLIHSCPKQLYELSPEAYKLFRQNQQWVRDYQNEEKLLNNDVMNREFGFAMGKGDGTVGRLAFAFHLATTPLETYVQADTMRKAIDFFRSYVIPALRYAYGEVAGVITDSMDIWMAGHILAIAHEESVTMRQLKRSAKRQLVNFTPAYRDQAILDAVAPLEDVGWLILTEENRRSNHFTWAINPQLKEAFADHRKQILKVRQKRTDEGRLYAEKFGHKINRKLVTGYQTEWDDEDD